VFVFAVVSDEDVHLLGGWIKIMKLVAHRIKILDATTAGVGAREMMFDQEWKSAIERIVPPQKSAVRFAHEYFMDWVSRERSTSGHETLYFPLTLNQYPACIFNRYPHHVLGPGLVRNVHIAPLFRRDSLTRRALREAWNTGARGAWNVAIFGKRTVGGRDLIVSTDSSRIALANPGRFAPPMSISDPNLHTTSSTFTQFGLAPSLVIVDLSIEAKTNPRNKAGNFVFAFSPPPPHSVWSHTQAQETHDVGVA